MGTSSEVRRQVFARLCGRVLPWIPHVCPYLSAATSCLEEYVIERIDDVSFSCLLERGYRHFGRHFFRPLCPSCFSCVPIRVLSVPFRRSRGYRRLLARNSDLRVRLVRPVVTLEAYDLYRRHKERFSRASGGESYPSFADAFFTALPFAYVLEMRLGDRLVCAAHLDITDRAVSAAYCYYDPAHASRGLGRYAIYRELDLARERGIPYVYLGYYIRDHPHMAYKADYYPNQILVDDTTWVDFRDRRGRFCQTDMQAGPFFRPTRPLLSCCDVSSGGCVST
jgi:arginine-tRNA-protein transferase